MFVGVILRPQPEQNLEEKNTNKRGSRTWQLERDTHCSNRFHHGHDINQLIIERDWRNVYDDEMYTTVELMTLIAAHYELDDNFANTLCLQYVTHAGEGATKEKKH